MRAFIATALLFVSTASFAQYPGNKCAKYENIPRYMTAIEVVAKNAQWATEEMCTLERIADVQAEDAMVINRKGEEELHVRVYLHRTEDSCLYMVRNADLVVTAKRCYSTY